MDSDAVGAITAVWHEDSARARAWFTMIGTVHATPADGDEAPNWDGFAMALETAAATEFHAETVQGFVDHVKDLGDPMGVVRKLADAGNLDEIITTYDDAVARWGQDDGAHVPEGYGPEAPPEPAPGVAPDTVEFSQDAWFAYLRQWDGGWDGTEGTWDTFVAGFLHHAPDGSRDIARQFAEQLGALGVAERITGLADYGITVAAPPLTEAPAQDLGAAQDVGDGPVESPEDLDHLEHVVPLANEVLAPALAELFEDMPEAAELSPEELEQLISEVLEEELAALDAG
jgi:hypothetical protein